ncbi:sensor histidine kinase [Kitasatospora sp. NPDC101183]|uniref:sensor histidine kinase n=1 Tax=Kitasatospora sp. NPDC101183 TaxID=3364100 RepID=UPI003815D3A5
MGLRRLSVRMRAAIASAVASVLAFGLATVWVGDAVRQQWVPAAEARAAGDAALLEQAVATSIHGWLGAPPIEGYQDSPYVILYQDGTWAKSDRMTPGEFQGLAPLPSRAPELSSQRVTLPVVQGASARPSDGASPGALPGAGSGGPGHSATFIRRTTGTVQGDRLVRLMGPPQRNAQQLTIYVMVDDTMANRASALVNRILGWYLVPGASLFVALVAWWVTGLALRPVEAIRRRMERIGGGAFHERVPVPPGRDGIARLAETTNTTLGRLEHAVTEQRRLVADASHELRTPVAVLRHSLEVALAHPEQARWPEVVAEALADTERLQLLADDLLLLARTEERRTVEEEVDLHDLVAEQVAERGCLPGGPRVCAPRLDEASVRGTEVLLGRVLRNLLDNAVRHAAGEVLVSLQVADGRAVLTVADDGPGIPAADRERVFERFVRLDDARGRVDGGAGLGLALVRGIAGSLGGTVRAVEPGSGRGAELVVELPVSVSGADRQPAGPVQR